MPSPGAPADLSRVLVAFAPRGSPSPPPLPALTDPSSLRFVIAVEGCQATVFPATSLTSLLSACRLSGVFPIPQRWPLPASSIPSLYSVFCADVLNPRLQAASRDPCGHLVLAILSGRVWCAFPAARPAALVRCIYEYMYQDDVNPAAAGSLPPHVARAGMYIVGGRARPCADRPRRNLVVSFKTYVSRLLPSHVSPPFSSGCVMCPPMPLVASGAVPRVALPAVLVFKCLINTVMVLDWPHGGRRHTGVPSVLIWRDTQGGPELCACPAGDEYSERVL